MAKKFWRKLAALVKIETSYGVDPVPTGAANAVQLLDVSYTPVAGDEVPLTVLQPFFGSQGSDYAGQYMRLEATVQLAGSGVAGTAPAWGPLMRACGMAETIVAATSAAYQPASSNQESAYIYFYADGVLHKGIGVRGTAVLDLAAKGRPTIKFTLTGLFGPVTDAANPTVVMTAWKRALIVSNANTPTCNLYSVAALLESLQIDLGNAVAGDYLVGSESIEITDRKVAGTAVVRGDSVAAMDWMGAFRARTRGALQLVHGITAGNIIEITAPQIEIGPPAYSKSASGFLNVSLPLMFCYSAGDDEIVIKAR